MLTGHQNINLEFALLACCFARWFHVHMCLRIFLLLVDVMFIGVFIIYLDFISFALFRVSVFIFNLFSLYGASICLHS